MPFETRSFSADIDFTNMPEGKYVMTARLDFGTGPGTNTSIQKMFEVFDSKGEKLVFSAEENTKPVANSGG